MNKAGLKNPAFPVFRKPKENDYFAVLADSIISQNLGFC